MERDSGFVVVGGKRGCGEGVYDNAGGEGLGSCVSVGCVPDWPEMSLGRIGGAGYPENSGVTGQAKAHKAGVRWEAD